MFQHTARTVLGGTLDAKHSIFGVHGRVNGRGIGSQRFVAGMDHGQHCATDKGPDMVHVVQVDIGAHHVPGRFLRTGRVDDLKMARSTTVGLNRGFKPGNNDTNVHRTGRLDVQKQTGRFVLDKAFVPVGGRQSSVPPTQHVH